MTGSRVMSRVRAPGPLPFILATAVALVAYSSWNRPIWYDEMVYFVLGGFDSTADVLAVINETTTNVNQGVTGAYMLLSYWGLEIFGAHSWALRLPSMVFAVYGLIAAALFLRGRRVGWWGVAALPVLLMGQETLMYYAGEARTYMPLAAATLGALAYYFIPQEQRRQWGPRLLGWSAVLIGVLFHPYFALYWPLVLAFALTVTRQWRYAIRFANPLLVVVGTAIYFTVAGLTWLRGTAKTDALDPYIWLGDSLFWAIPSKLLQFIYVQRPLIVFSAVLVAATVVLATRGVGIRSVVARWWPPVLLIVVAFLAAWILAAISLIQGFWIIQRQWIASIALVSVAIIWFWSRAIQSVRAASGTRAAAITRAAVGVLIAMSAIAPAMSQFAELTDWRDQAARAEDESHPSEDDLKTALQAAQSGERAALTEDEWVEFSNANISAGGKVWDTFSKYYQDRDWDTFILEDPSP